MTAATGAALTNAAAFQGPRSAALPLAKSLGTEADPAQPILSLTNVSLSFGGVTALSNLDLSVQAGEIRAIIGPNGAGKSSLINLISGIYRPDRGQIRLGGRRFSHVPTHRLAAYGVARTFQNLALFKSLSVLDNVVSGTVAARRAGFVEQFIGFGRARREQRDAEARADAILDFLQLASVRDRLNQHIAVWNAEARRARTRAGGAAKHSSSRRADGRHDRGRQARYGPVRPSGPR